jgi:peptidoglycan/LPS O-acetylase OafA/YrhL
LTGLRFVAALGLLLDHVQAFFPGTAVFDRLGVQGVSFFFMLSGFVLTWSSSSLHVRTYFQRRFARIYPIYALAIVCSSIPLQLWSQAHQAGRLATQSGLESLWLLSLTQMWFPGNLYSGVDGPTWTLSIEAFFYLTFPVVARWCGRMRRSLRLVMVTAIVGLELVLYGVTGHLGGASWLDWFAHQCPVTREAEIMLGILVALAMRDGLRIPLGPGVAVTIIGEIVAWNQAWSWHPFMQAPSLIPSLALLVVTATADLRGYRTVLNSRVLVTLGSWSYALYLFHYIVFTILATPGLIAWPAVFTAPIWPMYPIMCLSAIAVSGLVYVFVEEPAERIIRAAGMHPPGNTPVLNS